MSETSMSAEIGGDPGPDHRRRGPVAAGTLLVAIGVALLLVQTGALPAGWHASIWPILLMLFGAARLLQVTWHGREGLFFVVAGAWWLAGMQGWLSLPRTWPVLIVGLGASIMLQAATAPPRDPSTRHLYRRHAGVAPWILLAILGGAMLSGDRHFSLGSVLTPNDGASIVAVAGHSERGVQGTLKSGDVIAVMGRSVLDLTQATVEPGETITVDVVTLMGNSTIRVPEHWTVDVEAVAAFGRINDNREYLRDWATPTPDDPAAPQGGSKTGPRIVVDGLVMMGSLLITS